MKMKPKPRTGYKNLGFRTGAKPPECVTEAFKDPEVLAAAVNCNDEIVGLHRKGENWHWFAEGFITYTRWFKGKEGKTE